MANFSSIDQRNLDCLWFLMQPDCAKNTITIKGDLSLSGGLAVGGPVTAGDLRLARIQKIVSDSGAVALHYSISAWDDDPNWTDKCEGTSWYNETLNTSARGKTRKFPDERLCVLDLARLTIYDLTDPDCPMWMVLNIDVTDNLLIGWAAGGRNPSCVKFINGFLYVGVTGIGYLNIVNFITEESLTDYANGANTYLGNIEQRNDRLGRSGVVKRSDHLVNRNVNAIAVTLLPNQPINPATGMRYPTIAVGTEGGVSIIDGPAGIGTVVDITGYASYGGKYIHIDPDRVVFKGDYSRHIDVFEPIPSGDKLNTDVTRTYTENSIPASPLILKSQRALTYFNTSFLQGNTGGLLWVKENPHNQSKEAAAYITTNYNTGMMRGDIKACLMSDTEAGTVGDTELVTNGDFATDTDWVKGIGWSIGSGVASCDGSQTAGSNLVQYTNTFESGKVYKVTGTILNWVADGVKVRIAGGIDTTLGAANGIIYYSCCCRVCLND